MRNKITKSIESTIEVLGKTKSMAADIEKAAVKIRQSISRGGKLVIFGNGGSAADAQHIAAELTGRFRKERESLPALALTTNTSVITSLGNDFGFNEIFSRQISSLVNKNDVVIAISTSGNSENVLEGIKKAQKKGAYIIGFTGSDGGKMEPFVDLCIKVPSNVVSHIQEGHIVIGHILCMLIEE